MREWAGWHYESANLELSGRAALLFMNMDVQTWAFMFGLAAVLPLALYGFFDIFARPALRERLGDVYRIHVGSFSLLGTVMVLLAFLQFVGAEIPNLLGLQFLVLLAVVLAVAEEAWKLPTQFSLSFRFTIAIAAYLLGFRFTLVEKYPDVPGLLTHGADLVLTVVFYVGILYTISLIDSLRGLAPGVVLIVSMTLLSLMTAWAQSDIILLPLIVGGICLGHLFLLGADRHLHLGSVGQILVGVMLAATTLSSRTWGLTVSLLAVPLLACAAPLADRMYAKFARLRAGEEQDYPAHLHGLLLKLGFQRRWVVLMYWIVTLQIGVLIHVAYMSKSLPQAVAIFLSFAMLVIFPIACLLRLAERDDASPNDRPLRILFLSHYFHPEVNAPASRLYEHARQWQRGGHSVTVICPVPSAPHGWPYKGFRNALWHEETVDGIRVIRIWTFIAANRRRVRRTLNYVSYMISSLLALVFVRKHDIMVATSPQFFCGFAGALATLFRKEQFILEIRDIWPESIAAVGAGRKKFLLDIIGYMAKWMYKRADRIVTVGDGYRSKLLEIGAAPPEDISVITNGIDFETFDQPTTSELNAVKNRWDMTDHFVVSYVGTIGMAHALEVVLDVAEKLRTNDRIRFLIVGDGAEHDRLQDIAEERNLRNVRFTGLVPKREVPALISASGATLVHLRNTELFKTVLPSKLFEGMALGKPVLLGVLGEAETVLKAAKGGIVFEPENADALAKAIVTLAGNTELCESMGRSGAEHVRRHFDRSTLAERYVTEMRELISHRPGSDSGITSLAHGDEDLDLPESTGHIRPVHHS